MSQHCRGVIELSEHCPYFDDVNPFLPGAPFRRHQVPHGGANSPISEIRRLPRAPDTHKSLVLQGELFLLHPLGSGNLLQKLLIRFIAQGLPAPENMTLGEEKYGVYCHDD